MRYLIASDIHGSAYYAQKMMELYLKTSAEKLILLGDLLYHGPRNPLPKEYDPQKVAEILNAFSDSILCVRGNCDADVDQLLLHFPILSDSALIVHPQTTVFLTHGHVYHRDHLPPLPSGAVLMHGHTHVPALDPIPGGYCVNPGSVSLPKGNSVPSCLFLTEETMFLSTLDGQIYQELPFSQAKETKHE